MVTDLMNSEYGKEIATEWTKPNKRLLIKCTFVGALISAGVLEVSFNALAPKLAQKNDKHATLAKYLGYGKKQSYFVWLCQYVKS